MSFSPLVQNRNEHIWDFEKTRLNLQGAGSRKWQSRNTRRQERLPDLVDWTQGELVQDDLIFDYTDRETDRGTALSVRTKVKKETVPLLIAPSWEELDNRNFIHKIQMVT